MEISLYTGVKARSDLIKASCKTLSPALRADFMTENILIDTVKLKSSYIVILIFQNVLNE